MDPDQIVSALTYQSQDRPTLASQVDAIVSGVAETGFGTIPRPAVFRTVLAIAGEPDIMTPRWEAVADTPLARHASAPGSPTLQADHQTRLSGAVEYLPQTL